MELRRSSSAPHPTTGDHPQEVEQIMAPAQREKSSKLPPKRTVCSADDYLILLEYLEDIPNFEKLFGAGRKIAVGGKFLKKGDAWELAATELKGRGFKDTSGKNLYKKWQRYFTKYREAKKLSNQSGGGLTDAELKKGIPLEEKLNGICEHFYKMDKLLGNRVNVQPKTLTGAMRFQKFSEAAVPSQTLVSQLQDIVNISTPSPAHDHSDLLISGDPLTELTTDGQELDKSPPPWMRELPDEQQSGGQGGDLEHQHLTDDHSHLDTTEAQQGPSRNTVPQAQPGELCLKPTQGEPPSTVAPKSHIVNLKTKKLAVSANGELEIPKGCSSASKPSLADVFQDSKVQEAEMRCKYGEKKKQLKREWKMAALSEQREARHDVFKKRKFELEFEADQKRLEREEQVLEAQRERLHRFEEADRERSHQNELAKQKNKLDLIVAGWSQNKSQDEIAYMCSLLDGRFGKE